MIITQHELDRLKSLRGEERLDTIEQKMEELREEMDSFREAFGEVPLQLEYLMEAFGELEAEVANDVH